MKNSLILLKESKTVSVSAVVRKASLGVYRERNVFETTIRLELDIELDR